MADLHYQARKQGLGRFGWALVLAAIAAAGCGSDDDGGAVGSPCNRDDECRSGLICDIHDGRGSCQEPHDHDEEEGDDDDHDHDHDD